MYETLAVSKVLQQYTSYTPRPPPIELESNLQCSLSCCVFNIKGPYPSSQIRPNLAQRNSHVETLELSSFEFVQPMQLATSQGHRSLANQRHTSLHLSHSANVSNTKVPNTKSIHFPHSKTKRKSIKLRCIQPSLNRSVSRPVKINETLNLNINITANKNECHRSKQKDPNRAKLKHQGSFVYKIMSPTNEEYLFNESHCTSALSKTNDVLLKHSNNKS